MGDNDNVETLINALKEQTEMMSKTFTQNTNTYCKTVIKIHKRDSILFIVIFISFLIFLITLYLL